MVQRHFPLFLALSVLVFLPSQTLRADEAHDAMLALAALRAACPADTTLAAMRAALPERAAEASQSTFDLGLGLTGWRRQFAFADGTTLEVSRLAAGPALERIVVELDRRGPQNGEPQPILEARAERQCEQIQGRRLIYSSAGRAQAIAILDAALRPTGRTLALDPPVPAGKDPGGVTVALLDTGVNYLQPLIAARLARDAAGASLGYDYWDDDPRPFDVNLVASPFHPARHGTGVANALLAEAPYIRLVPLRYPRTDPVRLGAAVDRAAAAGARILLVGVGSYSAENWRQFGEAARRHPSLLIVTSAGSQGENIDDRAYFPAALDLLNQLVVGAADGFGQPVRSNWGARRVHVLAPGEKVVARDFDGLEQAYVGAEYAAARVAALAARLAMQHPDWDGGALRAAILSRARMRDADAAPRSAFGTIPADALVP